MAFTTAELFAARGDEWNTPNYQHHAANRGWTRRCGERVMKDEIEGYDAPTGGPRMAVRKPSRFVDPPKALNADPDARRRANEALRARQQIRKALRAPEVINVR